ncbi:MAG: asparaginase [Anaerolineales bacterium]|nr:asparaginase [Anaerolineales bacterium]
MSKTPYLPIFELTRGETVESIHYGALAVVDASGQLLASYGDDYAVTFLRSTSKPIQILPFVEAGGLQAYDISPRELAVMCASHSGTDEHVAVISGIQKKIGLYEDQLLCGTHPPIHKDTARELLLRGEEPTPIRHNCSGKHTGMLALATLKGWDTEDYINPEHPVQQAIIKTFAEMADLPVKKIALGTDGCSVPVFAVPLYNAALAFACLADSSRLSEKRALACRTITAAMMDNPDMVAGPERFDTRLMEVGNGRIFCKGGAEGYQGIGVLPGNTGAPALGIAFKISDGDAKSRARPAVAIEILHQLSVLTGDDLHALADYGPRITVYNWRKLVVGKGYPVFTLSKN